MKTVTSNDVQCNEIDDTKSQEAADTMILKPKTQFAVKTLITGHYLATFEICSQLLVSMHLPYQHDEHWSL
jgi:hypothetical protein